MTTREATKSVSYRRKRDYSTHIKWTYELNKGVYSCYKNAKEDPVVCYMKRMKTYRDELHPELNLLNVKQLRQQATYVKERN